MPARPTVSYVVWHTQRTGSTLLCTALEATGIAGQPDEWPEGRLADDTIDAQSARERLWSTQTTANGVLGVKWSFYKPWIDDFFGLFCTDRAGAMGQRRQVWQSVFPNCRHIVMTRRDKVSLAVSWWKLISGGRGHLSRDGSPLPWQKSVPTDPVDLAQAYDFSAIQGLIDEQALREAALRELLNALGASPLVVVYEAFVQDYESTVRSVLDHIGVGGDLGNIPAPLLSRTSNQVDAEWVERFHNDLKSGMR